MAVRIASRSDGSVTHAAPLARVIPSCYQITFQAAHPQQLLSFSVPTVSASRAWQGLPRAGQLLSSPLHSAASPTYPARCKIYLIHSGRYHRASVAAALSQPGIRGAGRWGPVAPERYRRVIAAQRPRQAPQAWSGGRGSSGLVLYLFKYSHGDVSDSVGISERTLLTNC